MTPRRPNYVGIIAGTIVMFAFGAIWYTALGGEWLAAVGKTKADLSGQGYWPFLVSFVAGLLVSYCFDNMLWHYERADAAKGAQVGFLTGVCIYLAMVAMLYSYAGRGLTLFLIDGGYGLIGFVITGAVVGALRGRLSRSAA
ncbi:MAG TPA: DUF1761 domain-containing protein [Candidatus Elarobacter sp.]|jgi:hypothetical protein|nr:DUF1761 domain-containing protein [Candidatus Elarobacter sp.]